VGVMAMNSLRRKKLKNAKKMSSAGMPSKKAIVKTAISHQAMRSRERTAVSR